MPRKYRWNEFVLDLDGYRLERNGLPLALEPKAFNLLVLLIGRPGHVFTKQEIFETLWADTAVTDHALTRVVAQLRRVLGDEARQARYLETVPTRGYRWICAVQEGDPPAALPQPVPVAAVAVRSKAGVRFAIAASLILVVLAVVGWVRREGPAKAVSAAPASLAAPAVAWPLQLTTHRGLDFQPAVSPAGDAIAFVSDRSGSLEIYLRGLSGAGIETPLTSDGAQNVQPAWTPDGSRIAFHSYQRGGIWVMPSRGGAAKQVAESGSRPAWSPDGRSIAFQSDEHPDAAPTGYAAQVGSTLWLTDADGKAARPLTRGGQPSGGHAAPAWSPNGKLIAFSNFEGGRNNGIWIVEVGSGNTWQLLTREGVYELAFAPDGSALFIAGGESVIIRLPIDPAGRANGTPSVIPVSGVPGVRGLSLSPDGTRVVFAGVSLDSQIWKQPIRKDGTAAGAASPLTNDTSRRNSMPAISPDGSRITYVSTRRGEQPNVWTMKIDGSAPLQLTSDDSPDHQPSWSPDGRRVAYKSYRDNTIGVWTIDVETRRDAPVMTLAGVKPNIIGRMGEVQISPSLKQIAFSVFTPPAGKRRMYVTGTDRYAARVVGTDDVSVGYPVWSPDDRYLAVEVKDDLAADESTPGPNGSVQAGVLDVASGQLRLLTRERGHAWVRSWAPDGSQVAAAVLRAGLWSLRAIDVTTRRQSLIYEPDSPRVYVRYPDWSRSGDVVVFERGEIHANIWSLPIQK